MEKDFVPYEQALALKEIEYDEPYFRYYDNKGKLFYNALILSNYLHAPTFSQVFRWFKEKHNLFHEIQIDRTAEPKFCFDIFQYEHFGNYEEIRIGEWYLYRTQEEAELECLKELIEIVKRK